VEVVYGMAPAAGLVNGMAPAAGLVNGMAPAAGLVNGMAPAAGPVNPKILLEQPKSPALAGFAVCSPRRPQLLKPVTACRLRGRRRDLAGCKSLARRHSRPALKR